MRLYPTQWNKLDPVVPKEALDLGLSLSFTKLLLSRVGSLADIPGFLNPQLLDEPMVGEIEAAERLLRAILGRERIGIFGDYDVDGVTATALVTRLLRHHGLEPAVFLPSRYREGYGLNPASVHLVQDVDLLLSVDCGITSVAETLELQARGIDVIITDHHEPKVEIPPTIVMNPKLGDYGFPDLAGVGVAYKLARRLERLGLELPDGIIELAALGTVADVMPLRGENRRIVQDGLRRFPTTSNPGLRLLLLSQNLLPTIRASDLGFRIGPLLNAVGRLDSPWPAYELLTETDPFKLQQALDALLRANQARKLETDRILGDIDARLEHVPPIIIEKHDAWLGGVLGLAASKVAEKYRRPVILLDDGEVLKGSGRSIGQFSLLASLEANQSLLQRFGGHHQAAGLEIVPGGFEAFRQAMEQYAQDHLTPDDTVRRFDYHPIELRDVRLEFLDELERLEPFGAGNPSPIFRLDRMLLQAIRRMGRNQTSAALEFRLCDRTLRVVTFDVTPDDWRIGIPYDVLVRLERNTFHGVSQLQLMLVDYRESVWRLRVDSPMFWDEMDRLWTLIQSYDPTANQVGMVGLREAAESGEVPARCLGRLKDTPRDILKDLVAHLPTRADLVSGYRELKALGEGFNLRSHDDPVRLMLQVKLFEQLGLLTYTENDFLIKLDWDHRTKKFDLEDSAFYRQSQKILEDYHELD